MVEGDEGFGADYAGDDLELVVEELHEVFVVTGEELDEHCVGACGEVTFYDFGYFFKLGYDFAVEGSALEVDSDVGAGAVAEDFWVDVVAGACDYVEVDHALYALVYGCAGDSTFLCYVFGGYAGVAHYDFEDASVEVVDFFHYVYL